MKIGWLVWHYDSSENPELYGYEVDWAYKCIQIVYAEIIP